MQTAENPILHETAAAIRQILGGDLDALTVERVAIGVFFTGVKLSNGAAGACATPIKSIPEAVCCPSSAMAMPFPGRLRGRRALGLLKETAAVSGIRRAVGIAVMNALADLCWERRPVPELELRRGVDAFDATEIHAGDRVVVVGAFVPFPPRAEASKCRLPGVGDRSGYAEIRRAAILPAGGTGALDPAEGRCRADDRHHPCQRHARRPLAPASP